MLAIIKNMFHNDFKNKLSIEDIAHMLNTDPKSLDEFEKAYCKATFDNDHMPENLFEINAKQMANFKTDTTNTLYDQKTMRVIDKIVQELIAQTQVYQYSKGKTSIYDYTHMLKELKDEQMVDKTDILEIDESVRPQLSGRWMYRDIPGTGKDLIRQWHELTQKKDPNMQKMGYDIFRQGMDILDLDNLTYAMIDQNVNSMGYWLPRITDAVDAYGFFKIPDTKIIKVPITMLQLTRGDYASLTRSTLDIVDQYCYKVFGLDENKDYFIKTGLTSSKQDFRNAHVFGAKEVRELGEYLLFIHWQILQLAHFDLSGDRPIIYGPGTTTEWVVREFIKDTENNPTIYHGLPLHTEYRVFVDFDKEQVLGVHNYWDPDLMINTFTKRAKNGNVDAKHDLVTYLANKERILTRYEKEKGNVVKHIQDMLPFIDMNGQWSIDVMQNGNDFYLIDMAVAEHSAFYQESVPVCLRNPQKECWIPDLKKSER